MDDSNNEGVFVVLVNTLNDKHKWEVLTEFYFDTLDDAYHFYDFEADELIPVAYKHINNAIMFEVSIWDDTDETQDDALEVKMLKPITSKE